MKWSLAINLVKYVSILEQGKVVLRWDLLLSPTAWWKEKLGADVFSTRQGREAVTMGRAAVTYSTKATCLTQIVSREQVKVSLPLTLARVSWIKFLSWWALLPALIAVVAVAVILIPVLAASTLAWTGLACDSEVVSGSFFAVESFGMGIAIIVLLFIQARAAIDWVLNKWPFTVQIAL